MSEDFFMRPCFVVKDVAASVAYYRERLGFEKRWEHVESVPIIAEVERGGFGIILDSRTVLPKAQGRSVVSLSMHRPRELGALYRELVGRGAKVLAPPLAVTWQADTYQLDVEDLDGNVLMFWGALMTGEEPSA